MVCATLDVGIDDRPGPPRTRCLTAQVALPPSAFALHKYTGPDALLSIS